MNDNYFLFLRELLTEEPSRELFRLILDWLAEEEEYARREIAIAYIEDHIEHWPQALRYLPSIPETHPGYVLQRGVATSRPTIATLAFYFCQDNLDRIKGYTMEKIPEAIRAELPSDWNWILLSIAQDPCFELGHMLGGFRFDVFEPCLELGTYWFHPLLYLNDRRFWLVAYQSTYNGNLILMDKCSDKKDNHGVFVCGTMDFEWEKATRTLLERRPDYLSLTQWFGCNVHRYYFDVFYFYDEIWSNMSEQEIKFIVSAMKEMEWKVQFEDSGLLLLERELNTQLWVTPVSDEEPWRIQIGSFSNKWGIKFVDELNRLVAEARDIHGR